jgi:hypothetical protein
MTWDAAGSLGEIIGAIAVVVSVVYLALQIKGQTRQAKLAAGRELSEQYRLILNRVIDNEDFSELYLEGVTNYSALSNNSRIKMSLFLRQMFRNVEQQYLHIERENVDSTYFDTMRLSFFQLLRFPGVQDWWEGSREVFAPGFRDVMDMEIGRAKQAGYESSFKDERERREPE